jgi:hypothetical protein
VVTAAGAVHRIPLASAAAELIQLAAAALRRGRWTHDQHDSATRLVREVYALGLLRSQIDMDADTADDLMRRLRALLQDRAGLLNEPADWIDRLTEVLEDARDAAGDAAAGIGAPDLEP